MTLDHKSNPTKKIAISPIPQGSSNAPAVKPFFRMRLPPERWRVRRDSPYAPQGFWSNFTTKNLEKQNEKPMKSPLSVTFLPPPLSFNLTVTEIIREMVLISILPSLPERIVRKSPDWRPSYLRSLNLQKKNAWRKTRMTVSWKMMVGRLLSFWGGTFSGAMLNFQGVFNFS